MLIDTLLLRKLHINVFIITDPCSVHVKQNCLHDSFAEDFEVADLSPDSAQFSSFLSPPEQMCNEKRHDRPQGLSQGMLWEEEILEPGPSPGHTCLL